MDRTKSEAVVSLKDSSRRPTILSITSNVHVLSAAGCPNTTLRCETTRTDFYCLSLSRVCDGTVDCIGAIDEINCGTNPEIDLSFRFVVQDLLDILLTECQEFQTSSCHWGLCLSGSSICDGINDCIDWSDEFNCGKTSQLTSVYTVF